MIFPKIAPMNSKPVRQVKQVRQVPQANTANTQIGKLSFKKPTGCGCGMNKWKVT
jgi:hypothetical protein